MIKELRCVNNKEIIELYPWLALYDDHSNLIEDTTLLDELPKGWRELVLDMCYDIGEVLYEYDIPKEKYQVLEAKEKWGVLSWCDYLGTWDKETLDIMPDEIEEVVQEYENKSKEVCMMCGATIEPNELMCKECIKKIT